MYELVYLKLGNMQKTERDAALEKATKMSGDHDRCFSTLVLEAFRQVFFNANALPCITIGADVWGKSGIMTGVY